MGVHGVRSQFVDSPPPDCLNSFIRTMKHRGRRATTWLASSLAIATLVGACNESTPSGTLVGFYAVQGVLTENSCGQSALPAASPLKFDVQIREDDGVGYWRQAKQGDSTGSLNARGEFRFSVSQTKVLSSGQMGQGQLQPNNFITLMPDPDLQQPRTCAITIRETVSGSLRRRNAADGGAVVEVSGVDAAASSTEDDLSADHIIDVAPSAGSDCNMALMALGGSYLALPCDARYTLRGTLLATNAADTNPASAAGAPAAH
jgi:hypothetical protein